HGFVRAANGAMINVDLPGAANGTFPAVINARGDTVGQYVDANGVGHGFLRSHSGNIVTFDVPAGGGSSTSPNSLSSKRHITRNEADSAGGDHAFVFPFLENL